MDSLRVNSGIKRLLINDDPNKILAFDPTDTLFVDRFYALMRDFETKQNEYQARAEAIDQEQETDENGLPVNLDERLVFLHEVCEYMQSGIDKVFGNGTSQMLFEGRLSLDAIMEFFEGITPFIQTVRSEKITRYTTAKSKNQRVMK